MINEIKTELHKMIENYEHSLIRINDLVLEVKEHDTLINVESLKKICSQTTTLINKLRITAATLDSTEAFISFKSLLSVLDEIIDEINPLEKTQIANKILGSLDQIREIHCIQLEYFETFDAVLQDLSTLN